ncbi:MAG: hypothetical protein JNM14_04040, partial [Ferruginibacter sp.]|nr:hypothetical protein [Ferruginibacter sp.]
YVHLSGLPLTVNGKLNRKALPEPDIKPQNTYTAPGNEIEKKLVEIWARVLNVDAKIIGTRTNFFELGGHSMDVIKACNEIDIQFSKKVPVAIFFEFPTISMMSEWLSKSEQRAEKQDEEEMENGVEQMIDVLNALNQI